MSNGIKRFEELIKTDAGFQQKFQKAAESYEGEKTAEAIFSNIFVPLAEEYGITATFEDFND